METHAAPGEGGRRRRRGARPAAIALGLVLLLALVALASGARGSATVAAAPRGIPEAFFDAVLTVAILAIAATVLVVLLLRFPTVRMGDGDREKHSLFRMVLATAIVTLVLFVLMDRRMREGFLTVLQMRGEEERDVRELPEPYIGGRRPEFRWEAGLLLLALAGGAAGAVLLVRRARRKLRALPSFRRSLADELAAVLDDTLADLRLERDARRAVIAAYARMERALAAHGLPRRPSEAPLEYLARALRETAVPPAAVLELTTLFERAKFSHRDVDEAMKDDAIAALVTVRDDLRAAA